MARDPLNNYRHKQPADATLEPFAANSPRRDDPRPIFVVQKHAASTRHDDVRLEIDGILNSWASSKGPSTDPRDKRLAIEIEAMAHDEDESS